MNTLIKSNVLDAKTKKKVVRSYIRGEDNLTNGRLKGLSEKTVEKIIKEAWETARNQGEKLEISKGRFLSEGEIMMLGQCAKYQSVGAVRKKYEIANGALDRTMELYAYMTGDTVETGRVDTSKVFEKVPGKTFTNCPCCGHDKLNMISTDGSITEFAAVLKNYGLTSASIKRNAFCPSCLNELFEVRHVEDIMVDGEKVRVPVDHELNGLVKFNHWAMKEI